MQNYKIIYSDQALSDIEIIEQYILYHLRNPDAAWDTVNGIMNTIDRLSEFPYIHSLVTDAKLAVLGFRLIYYKNYNGVYQIRNASLDVYIIRVLYNRRDWISLLKGR